MVSCVERAGRGRTCRGGLQQGGKSFCAAAKLRMVKTRRRAGKSGKVDAFEQWAVGDQECGAGVLQLEADFALAIGGIQKRRNASGESGGVVGDGEFPGIREKDGDDFSGFESGGDESAGEGFDEFSVFGIGEATVAGGIDERGLVGNAAAGLQHDVVNETTGGIG